MATSLPPTFYRRRSRQNLTCAVCREVYRSPRLLPCHHSFCLDCVEGLIKTDPRVFPCPECRRPTLVPKSGALGFPLNFYISEEDLELERDQPLIVRCRSHDPEPLTLFCVPCDQPICLFCKLTKHDHHETQDLSEAAVRCSGELKASKERLEGAIDQQSKVLVCMHDNLEAVGLKEATLLQEVRARRDAIVARVDKWCETVSGGIKDCKKSVNAELMQETRAVQQSQDSLLQLQQRLNHALNAGSDAEKVHMEKEMRQGKGREEEVSKIKGCIPTTTLRPGLLRHDHSLFSDDSIQQWLGSVVRFSLPLHLAMSEVVIKVFQCGQQGSCREVHALSCLDENTIYVSFGGIAPGYTNEQVACIDSKGASCGLWSSPGEKVSFLKLNNTTFRYSVGKRADGSLVFCSSGNQYVLTQKTDVSKYCTIATYKSNSGEYLSSVVCAKPKAFSATKDGKLFAIIEEGTCETQLHVCLFRRWQMRPFATYTPPNAAHFRPADVCFWQEGGQVKLLVADASFDSVHVIRIEDHSCSFERYLAAGSGALVSPTALCVDDQGHVWIGCNSGWVLRCEKQPKNGQAQVPDENASEGSCSGSVLNVDNASQLTETCSQLSTE